MIECNHKGHTRYTRRVMPNGTHQYMIQCNRCLCGIKSEKHKGKLHIRPSEIPFGEALYPWVTPGPGESYKNV